MAEVTACGSRTNLLPLSDSLKELSSYDSERPFSFVAFGCAQSTLFQCQPSTEQSGQVYTPNIPDSYFNATTLGVSTELMEAVGGTYVFTIPAESEERNCSGTVVAIQYCYHADLNVNNGESGREQSIFDLLSMTTLDASNMLTVQKRFTVKSTPINDICMLGQRVMSMTPHNCCTTTTLDTSQQFQIPPSSYTFGIQVLSVYSGIPYSFRACLLYTSPSPRDS